VERLSPYSTWLRCMICGMTWSPCILPGGKLPRGYWKCPDCEAPIPPY
jgi:hypothetical protein